MNEDLVERFGRSRRGPQPYQVEVLILPSKLNAVCILFSAFGTFGTHADLDDPSSEGTRILRDTFYTLSN